ncbi:MAG: pitrilysin family protein [Patescibacteria group bacterium]
MDGKEKYRIEEFYLPNGLRVILKRVNSPKVSGALIVRCGPNYENKDNNGISHFLEHLVYMSGKGASRRSLATYKIERTGADLTPRTGKTYTEYNFDLPHARWTGLLRATLDAIANPDFSRKIFQNEQKIVANEILDDDKWTVFADKLVFPHHLLGTPILGTVKNIYSFTIRRLRAWHRKFYQPQRMVLVVAGNLSTAQLMRVLRRTKLFFLENKGIVIPEPVSPKIKWGEKDVDYLGENKLKIFFPVPLDSEKRLFFLYFLRIINDRSIVAIYSKIVSESGLHSGMAIDEDEYTELHDFFGYSSIDFWAPSHKILRRMERIFFNWLKKVAKNGLRKDMVYRVYCQAALEANLNSDYAEWWRDRILEAVVGNFFSSFEAYINPTSMDFETVKKGLEDFILENLCKNIIIIRNLKKKAKEEK